MEKSNLLRVFGLVSCMCSATFGVMAFILSGSLDGLVFYGLIFFASLCVISGNKLLEKILPFVVLAIAIIWLMVSFANPWLWVDAFAYIIWGICLLAKKKKYAMICGMVAATSVTLFKIILFETNAILVEFDAFDDFMIIVSSMISFDFMMLLHFNSKVANMDDAKIEVADNEIAKNTITFNEAVIQLRFLEFQLEKNYISEEEYQEKRAEFLMSISKL